MKPLRITLFSDEEWLLDVDPDRGAFRLAMVEEEVWGPWFLLSKYSLDDRYLPPDYLEWLPEI